MMNLEKIISNSPYPLALDLFYDEQIDKFQDLKTYLAEVEVHCIRKTIARNNGNVTKAAEQLGIHRSILYRKLKEYDEK
ncbi:sigma-54 dependent transcriptional regulator [Listeria grandensis FSL F6-0971]|uniref:Sigma-54 dependent transcriptional regulator n=1 Tax=Listeria grandensis FSL F6-0971 TaxID=1265819 RepID=W7BFJ2_9LIST|nr:sigma-54 dependent transcriptional regulator [Listeria grandensis FSL F6-0971]